MNRCLGRNVASWLFSGLLALAASGTLGACSNERCPFDCEYTPDRGEFLDKPGWDPGYNCLRISAVFRELYLDWNKQLSGSLRVRSYQPAFADLTRILALPAVRNARRLVLVESVGASYWWGLVVWSGDRAWVRSSGPIPLERFPRAAEAPELYRLPLEFIHEHRRVCGMVTDQKDAGHFLRLLEGQDRWLAGLGRHYGALYARTDVPAETDLADAWVIYMCKGGETAAEIGIDRPKDHYLLPAVVVGKAGLETVPRDELKSKYSDFEIDQTYPARLMLNGVLRIVYQESVRGADR